MSNKAKLKLTKMSGKDLILCLSNQLETEDFHMYDIKTGDGYYIFEFGDDTTSTFKIAEIPGWTFGTWLTNERTRGDNCSHKDKEIILFAQPTNYLDKFKPSRCLFKETFGRQVYMEADEIIEEFNLYEVVPMLEYMRDHPYKSFMRDRCLLSKWEDPAPLKSFIYYLRSERERKKELRKDKRIINKIDKILNKIPNSHIEAFSLYQENQTPAIEYYLFIKEECSIENINTLYNLEYTVSYPYNMMIYDDEHKFSKIIDYYIKTIKDSEVKLRWKKIW